MSNGKFIDSGGVTNIEQNSRGQGACEREVWLFQRAHEGTAPWGGDRKNTGVGIHDVCFFHLLR